MIEDLKRIRIEEIDKEIANLEKTMPVRKQYNWLERTITKKKEFAKSEYDYHTKQEEIKQKRQELEDKKSEYSKAEVPEELDLTFENAIKLLKDKGIDPVLTEADLTDSYVFTKPNIDNLDGLILVHKSGHVPTDSRIHSLKEAKIKSTVKYTIGEKEIETSFDRGRNTVHFTVNGEVSSHSYGNWDDKKYAILIPFKDVPKQEIKSASPADTFVLGGVSLTKNSWILVPKGEKEEVQKNNPQVNVLEYEGKNVSGYADQLIKNLGYNCKTINVWGFSDTNKYIKKNEQNFKEDCDRESHMYCELLKKEGLKNSIHFNSIYEYQEIFEERINQLLEILYYVYENKEILKDEKFRNELLNTIKKECYWAIQSAYGRPDKSTVIQMIHEKFKNTPFEIEAKSFDKCPEIPNITQQLSDILINKLLVEEKVIDTEEQKPSIKR